MWETQTHMRLTWARPGFAFAFRREAGRWPTEQTAWVEKTAAVVVGRQRVGRICWDGVMGGRGLAVHGGQTAAQWTTALHFHPVCQRYLVLDSLLFIHPGRGWGGRSRTRVWGHVFRGCGGETVEMRAGVRCRSEWWHRSRAGATAAGIAGASGV